MVEKAVIDAQVLFYFHYNYKKVPPMLRELKQQVINGEITVIIPTIAIALFTLVVFAVHPPAKFRRQSR